MIAMPVTPTYCINITLALFTNVYQGFAKHFMRTQPHLAHFSFAFIGQYNNAPAANAVAGEGLFFKRIA